MLQYSRRSSDAPEVVPSAVFVVSPTKDEQLFPSPTWTIETAQIKTESVHRSPILSINRREEFRQPRSANREHFRGFPDETELDRRQQRTTNLVITTCLLVLAFLAGGGIGGGVGGAIAAQRSSTKTQPSTSPITPGASNLTTIVDYAGCPLVHNETYTPPLSPSAQFIKICGSEITAQEGENIDMYSGNSTEKTFNACLDKCAARQGCVGATWFIFFAADPRRNSMCFLKNGTGNTSPGAESGWGRQLASGMLKV